MSANNYDVVIVGGGPAGLVAARYCLHAGLNTAILAPDLGGKLHYPFALRDLHPENTIWGAKLVAQFEEVIVHAQELPHLANQAKRVGWCEHDCLFQIALETGESITARSVVIATGVAPQRMYISGEKAYWGRGVSFSAVSHAPYFAGRDVAVVGGGRRALIAALELAPIAHHVNLIAAHPHTMFNRPEAKMLKHRTNVITFSNWEVQEIVGDDYVTSLNLVGANGEIREMQVEGVFIAFDLLPNNEPVRDLAALDEEGHIIVNQRCETNMPGLFAAGDVTNIQSEQVLVALGEGAKAGLSAWRYLVTHPVP